MGDTKRNLLICGILISLLYSCGQPANKIEQDCTGSSCSEADLNKPIGGEQPIPPAKEEERKPASETYRFPEYDSSWGLTKSTFDHAVTYYNANFDKIPNKRWVTVIDFAKHSSKKRFYLFDLTNQSVLSYLTSHGKNSDPDNDGLATLFSNTINSKQSSLGFYLTSETYIGSNGYSMKLKGLESSNDNAEVRYIVVHPASYVSEEDSYAGRSWGCPALDPKHSREIIDKIKNGSLLFIDSEPYSNR
ncbi:MAG: murein L,D-transpeptidase catalytic domain family protein [Oligoflexia bacterium]|nr:murein L,D-transpeptidase catalytic domain family protein [Oligoflexia bacterium]